MMNLAKTFCAKPLEADVGRSGHGPIVAGLTYQTIKVEAIGWAVQRMGSPKTQCGNVCLSL